jgi:hypothetical protein
MTLFTDITELHHRMECLHHHSMEQEKTGLAACQLPQHLQHLQKKNEADFIVVHRWS